MNEQRLSLVAVMMATVLAQGCATNRMDLVEQGIVSVETVPGKRVGILWIDVHKDGEETLVYGALQRCRHTNCPVTVHVDVTLLLRDGTELEQAHTEDIYVARHIHGRGINWTPFRVRFGRVPPKESKVKVVVHDSKHCDHT